MTVGTAACLCLAASSVAFALVWWVRSARRERVLRAMAGIPPRGGR